MIDGLYQLFIHQSLRACQACSRTQVMVHSSNCCWDFSISLSYNFTALYCKSIQAQNTASLLFRSGPQSQLKQIKNVGFWSFRIVSTQRSTLFLQVLSPRGFCLLNFLFLIFELVWKARLRLDYTFCDSMKLSQVKKLYLLGVADSDPEHFRMDLETVFCLDSETRTLQKEDVHYTTSERNLQNLTLRIRYFIQISDNAQPLFPTYRLSFYLFAHCLAHVELWIYKMSLIIQSYTDCTKIDAHWDQAYLFCKDV